MDTGEQATAVQEWLTKHRYPEQTVRGGSEELLRSWELTARELAEAWNPTPTGFQRGLGDRLTLEYLSREELLDEHETKRVHLADHQFQGATEPTDECAVGNDAATKNNWTKEREWWFWRKPLA